jgi:SAM-dependent methyltransferase
MNPTAQPALDRQAEFWDARATAYPDPREPWQRALMQRRLAHWPADARPAAGRRVLDVGAGTGALTLAAVEAGATVTALDVSAAMLDRLRQVVAPAQVRPVLGDWRSLDVDAAGWRGTFDLVVAQMVPSLREAADFERMSACSRGWCVFVGWGRERHDPWLEAAFAAHGVPWEVPAGVPLAAQCLRAIGVDTAPVYWRETWERQRPREVALRDAVDHLSVRGVSVDADRLRVTLAGYAAGDASTDRCEVEIGLLAWRAG